MSDTIEQPHATPDELLDMWKRASQEAPVPYKSSEEAVLNTLASSIPDYKYADEIPKMKVLPRFDDEARPMIRNLLEGEVLTKAFGGIAEGIANICDTTPLDLADWNRVAKAGRNMLAVLFDVGQMEYSVRSKRLFLAPVQVTVGMVRILAVRGFVSLLDPGRVRVVDIKFAAKGKSEWENHKYQLTETTTLKEAVCTAAANILSEQGVLRTPEVSVSPDDDESLD